MCGMIAMHSKLSCGLMSKLARVHGLLQGRLKSRPKLGVCIAARL